MKEPVRRGHVTRRAAGRAGGRCPAGSQAGDGAEKRHLQSAERTKPKPESQTQPAFSQEQRLSRDLCGHTAPEGDGHQRACAARSGEGRFGQTPASAQGNESHCKGKLCGEGETFPYVISSKNVRHGFLYNGNDHV